ncbi:hypothetical protein WIW50_18870 [Flavobacteriaceae bacterium 3-367]|uniref:hypothetical protein n=1 Tax=Eudoraea algarum TaxID=3417568 RepID=UPI003291DBFD
MNIDELARKELELYFKTGLLKGTIEERSDQIVYIGIAKEYRAIHQEYSILKQNKTGGASRWTFYFHLRPLRKTKTQID